MKRNKSYKDKLVVCKCGYNNKLINVKRYGTCTRCGAVLDEKAKFEYEMVVRLRLWRKKD